MPNSDSNAGSPGAFLAPFSGLPFFVAGTAFGDSALAVFVAGAAFGDCALAFVLAGAAFGDLKKVLETCFFQLLRILLFGCFLFLI